MTRDFRDYLWSHWEDGFLKSQQINHSDNLILVVVQLTKVVPFWVVSCVSRKK